MEIPATQLDLCYLPAVDQRALLRARSISAVELLEAYLTRIAEVNPAVNAIVTLDPEGARAQADAADVALCSGDEVGPLTGLVVAHKDLVPTAGMRTTWGSRLYADFVPTEDAAIVTRIREAGAVRIGKTNVPEMGAGSHTFNPVFGATHNPYALDRTAGGSSGGAAAALASGMLSLADGSDLGGSLRNPASFNNVVGFRSSIGRISRAPVETGWVGMSVLGAMGRTVADTTLLHAVLTGFDPRDPNSLPGDGAAFLDLLDEPVGDSLAGVRVGWSRTLGGLPVEPTVTEVLDRDGLATMSTLDADVRELEPDCGGAEEAFRTLRAWGMAQQYGELYRTSKEQLSENVVANVEMGLDLTAADIYNAYTARTRLVDRFRELFEEIDVLAAPTVQLPPFPVDWTWPREVAGETQPDYLGWMRSCWYISATGHPAISIPCGMTDDGLPVGLQLVGRALGEVDLLRVARSFEAANPAYQRRTSFD